MAPTNERPAFSLSTNELRIVAILGGIAFLMCTVAIIRPLITPKAAMSPLPVTGEALDDFSEVLGSVSGEGTVNEGSAGDQHSTLVASFLIDPNTAPPDSLELLPGVGRVLADRIVTHRAKYPFKSPLDLLAVRGIGTSTYENLRHYIRIDPNRIPINQPPVKANP